MTQVEDEDGERMEKEEFGDGESNRDEEINSDVRAVVERVMDGVAGKS